MSEYLTVTKLNQYIKSILESDFSMANIVLLGEVSSLTKHYTGHFYFTLKDDYSQIKCMMFSNYASKIDFDLKNGDQIIIRGYVGVYDKGGTYQVYCRSIEPYGEGQYLLKLAKLKEQLEKEGIFSKPKKDIPLFPKKIGLLTAKTGAAVHDYINTIYSRLKTEIYFFPCQVQGEAAPKSIISALNEASKYSLDLIVITRGGGSKEDLRCFNDEKLIRRLYELDVPFISAVGHQIDTTLCDYIADKICITPTDAANHSIISFDDISKELSQITSKLNTLIKHRFDIIAEKLLMLDRAILSNNPYRKYNLIKEKISNYEFKLRQLLITKLNIYITKNKEYSIRLNQRIKEIFLNKYHQLSLLKEKVLYLNPENILKNGYAVAQDNEGKVISSVKQIEKDTTINIILSDGRVVAKVLSLEDK